MIKLKIKALFCLLLIASGSWAQTISPAIITPQGSNYIAGGNQLSWTTGGLVTPTLTAGGYILTQSFEQPELQVWTGTIGPSGVCPGNIINVPFTQSGIISNTNSFIAQLSNAAGSFASPVTVGTLTGNVNGIIACTIPATTPAGNGYRIRVKSSLPLFTGPDNGTDFSVWAKPACSITAIPQNNTNTGGIPTNIYLGYGPQQVTLSGSASGGAPFSYAWTGNGTLSCYNCAAPVFAPTAAGIYNFNLKVTNANGCSSTCTITICVTNILVPGTNKVYVCHNGNTLSIATSAVPAHVPGHANDRLGRCDQQPCETQQTFLVNKVQAFEEEAQTDAGIFSIAAMPNPTRDYFNLVIKSSNKSLATVRISDMYGRILFTKTGVEPNETLRLGENLFNGTYLVNVMQDNNEQTVKVIKIN
ncbi:MAG: T9SS type A sorting domain-containing protein [Ferruginibacter sp.]